MYSQTVSHAATTALPVHVHREPGEQPGRGTAGEAPAGWPMSEAEHVAAPDRRPGDARHRAYRRRAMQGGVRLMCTVAAEPSGIASGRLPRVGLNTSRQEPRRGHKASPETRPPHPCARSARRLELPAGRADGACFGGAFQYKYTAHGLLHTTHHTRQAQHSHSAAHPPQPTPYGRIWLSSASS